MQGSGAPGPLLQNINLQMARDEYELNGQQGLDQLLSVLGGEEVQVALRSQSVADTSQHASVLVLRHGVTEECSACSSVLYWC